MFLTMVIAITGYFYFENQKDLTREGKNRELKAIANLKVEQIINWRRERLGDARVISEDHGLALLIQRWFTDQSSLQLKDIILNRMASLIKSYGYQGVILLDTQGNEKLSVPEGPSTAISHIKKLALEALHTNKILSSDLYYGKNGQDIHLDILAPLFIRQGIDHEPLGVIVLRINPYDFLYPMLQSWPAQNDTGETVLIRRDGNEVLYLNELRHQKKAALSLRRSISDPQLLAAMAIEGRRGVVKGVDYRGVPVIGALEQVPDSTWFIVAKVNTEEVDAPVRHQAQLIFSLIIALVACAGIGIGFIWRNAQTKLLQKAAEKLRQSNQELEQFAYVASHDLQEPLRMVASFTQLLAEDYQGRLDTEADEYIHFVVDGANRMQQLINDLLEYSRVRTEGQPFEITDCEEVLDQVLANLRAAIEENRAVITHDPLPAIPADEGQMVQLLQNLISNAIKFRSAETPRIHVTAKLEGGEWVFSVKDNGIGIEPQFHQRIFVIFQRLHGREEYPGTGIGLAICKRVVDRHGGRIWVESEPQKGATFYFTIPVR
jgi:signal transduction histidine kinase